tara:strand:- start:80 stop:265 length:186 start_codon:yes stop_codon:yes gene_type:complete
MPWIIPYKNRKRLCCKAKELEKKIKNLKLKGEWSEASTLESKLRNSWWGYKRYMSVNKIKG